MLPGSDSVPAQNPTTVCTLLQASCVTSQVLSYTVVISPLQEHLQVRDKSFNFLGFFPESSAAQGKDTFNAWCRDK